MKKEDFEEKLDQAAALCKRGRFEDAVLIYDDLNLNHVRQPKILQDIARAYERCKRYEDAEDILLEAKALAPKSRSTVFRLCTIAIKADELEDAQDYYKEFIQLGEKDSQRYVLQYRLADAQKASRPEKIKILEAYRNEDPDDRWMYELALLYAMEKRTEEAISTCEDITLWFNDGKYVEAAGNLLKKLGGKKEAKKENSPTKRKEDKKEIAPAEKKMASVEKPVDLPLNQAADQDLSFTMEVGEELPKKAAPVLEEPPKTDGEKEPDQHVFVKVTDNPENSKIPVKSLDPEEKVLVPAETPDSAPIKKNEPVKVPKASKFIEEENVLLEKELLLKQVEKNKYFGIPYEPVVTVDTWHFLVTGNSDVFTLDCAKEVLRQITKECPDCPKKVLKISAQKIGNASIINSLDHFKHNIVIIQNAGLLTEQQLQDFSGILTKEDHSFLIVFTGTGKEIQKILQNVPALQKAFTAVFTGKPYEPRDLLGFMKEWLYSEEARLTQDAEDYALDYAAELLKNGQGSYRNEMRAFAEKALGKAESGGFLKLSAGKVDDDGFLVLTEKHLRKADDRK